MDEGWPLGLVGKLVGCPVGRDGCCVGWNVGCSVGCCEGCTVGWLVGIDGFDVGRDVG